MKLGRYVLATTLMLGGCSVYDHRFVFEPDTQVVETTLADGAPLRTLGTVLGLRESAEMGDQEPVIAVQLRMENTGPASVDFDPASLVLLAGDQTRFGDPRVMPALPQTLAAGSVLFVEAAFPLPNGRRADDVDLSRLSLRWSFDAGGATRAVAADFTREPRGFYDRYPNRVGTGFHRYDYR